MISMMSSMAFAKSKKDEPKKEKEEYHAVETNGYSVQGEKPEWAKIYVGGEEVTGPGQIQGRGITGSVYIDFDGNDAILTLRNAVITGKKDVDDITYNIYSKNIDLTIVLEGENIVNSEDTVSGIAPADYAIDSYDNMEITGDGSLTVKGDESAIYLDEYNLTISGGNVVATSNDDEAIFLDDGDCTIKDAHVEAYSHDDKAIFVYRNCTIKDAHVEAYSHDDDAIQVTIGVCSIDNADVIVESGGESCRGIFVCYDLTINGTVNATGTAKGIYSSYGSITINGGNVTATGDNKFGIDAAGDLIINGGTVTATGARGGMRTWDGSVKANGGTIISTQTGGGDDSEQQSVKVAGDVPDDAGIASFTTVIGKGVVSLVSSGTDKAISGKVKNEIAGTGWESVDESGTKTAIAVNTAEEGQDLSKYKRVQFPAKAEPTPTPTPANVPVVNTTAKSSTRTTTIKWTWNAVNGASKYKVAYHKVGSKKWKVKTTKKTKYVLKGQKIKGLYEYKVAAVTASGDVWSNTSCRYFKTVKTKAKFSKGALKVSWKKDKGATGYEVFVARNKKMDGAQVIQVAATDKSYSVTGLEKGKYYVKVRPMKNYNGVTYTGILCKARKVRVK